MSGFSAWFPSSGISTKFDPKSTPTRPQICPTSSPKIPQINPKSHPGAGIDLPRLVAPSWPSYSMSFAGHIKNRVREKNVSLKGGVRLWPTRRWFLQSGGVGQVGKVGKSRGYLTCFFFHFFGGAFMSLDWATWLGATFGRCWLGAPKHSMKHLLKKYITRSVFLGCFCIGVCWRHFSNDASE